MGITNMAATIPGFLVPALVGALTHGVVSVFFIDKPSTFGNISTNKNHFFSLVWVLGIQYFT